MTGKTLDWPCRHLRPLYSKSFASTNQHVNASDTPIIMFYAEISLGGRLPVLDAQVVALIQPLILLIYFSGLLFLFGGSSLMLIIFVLVKIHK